MGLNLLCDTVVRAGGKNEITFEYLIIIGCGMIMTLVSNLQVTKLSIFVLYLNITIIIT